MHLIRPDWPAPARVHALASTRHGGVGAAPWDSLNLGLRCGDNPRHVRANRNRLRALLPAEPVWLKQVHGGAAVYAPALAAAGEQALADAAWSDRPGVVCGVLTADCLPILLCARGGGLVAAIHAGWRGLAAGVIENCVAALPVPGAELLAWLGAAIGPGAYEVGGEVYAALGGDAEARRCFRQSRPGHWRLDLYALARLRLHRLGVTEVCGGDRCTYSQEDLFFSYRRSGTCGRMFTGVWFL